MSVHKRGERWIVRWRHDNQQRANTFVRREDAELFDNEIRRAQKLNGAFRRLEVITASKKPTAKKPTHVYVIAAADKVKIGIANNPGRRRHALATGSHAPLTLIRTINTSEPEQLETALHARYTDQHVHGEWFNAEPVVRDLMTLTDDDLAALIRKVAR